MNQSILPHASLSSNQSPVNQYLSFTLGEEQYGVDILKVQEIRDYGSVTRVPDAPEYIKGVINLRGTIIPVMDLRLRMNMPYVEYGSSTVMIVLNLDVRVIGIVVDAVSDVISLEADHILPPPEFGTAVDTRAISGISTFDGGMVMLLDIDALMIETALVTDPEAVLAEAA